MLFNPFSFYVLVDVYEGAAPVPQWAGPPAYSPAALQPPPEVFQIQEVSKGLFIISSVLVLTYFTLVFYNIVFGK